MGFLTDDKNDYLEKLKASDFKDLLWLPLAFIIELYIEFKIAPTDEHLAGSLHFIVVGAIFILCSKGVSILSNLRWIMSPFGRKPFSIMTQSRSRLLGSISIVIGILIFLRK